MNGFHKTFCMQTQQGFALLPVVIIITVIASIALLINSQSAMNVNNVASQNEKTEVEYVAQAALQHATWTANNSGCSGYTLPATSLGSSSYSATFTPADDSPVTITATGTLANGVSHTITRNNTQIMNQSMQTTLLQPGPAEGIDTYIWDGAHKNTNFGTTNRLELNNQSAERNILIRFDLSSLPSSAKIISATLELYLYGGSGLSNGVIDVHRITRSWFEGVDDDKDPPTAPGATYLKYDGSSMFGSWSSSGGDYDPTPLATTTIPTLLAGWYQWDITDAAIGGPQSILAGNGILLTASGGSVDKIQFRSSDASVSTEAPKLTLVLKCECGVICGTPTDSLPPIAHWKLDESSGLIAEDSIGGHDGTLNNGPVWSPGIIDGALNFDGVNDAIRVSHNDALSLTEGMTFSAWINASSFNTSYQTILAKDDGGSGSNYWFGTYEKELVFGFWSEGWFREVVATDLDLETDTWYHLAASFDNDTDDVVLYLDGVQVQVGTLSFDPTVVTADISIGRSPDGEYWPGLLDDVRINNLVLDETDIVTLVAAGNGEGDGGGDTDPPTPPPEPPGDDCSGTFRDEFNTDGSYSGNDGTLKWSTDWQEVNEKDGPDTGDERVTDDDKNEYVLQIRDNDSGGEGVYREADLSKYIKAAFSFEYRRDGFDNKNDYVTVEISNNDGKSWDKLESIGGSGTDSNYVPKDYDISTYIASNTQIRFLTSADLGSGDEFYIDNVQIEVKGCTK